MFFKYRVTLPAKGTHVIVEIDTTGLRPASPETYKRYIQKELFLVGYCPEYLDGPYDIPSAKGLKGDLSSIMWEVLIDDCDGVLCY